MTVKLPVAEPAMETAPDVEMAPAARGSGRWKSWSGPTLTLLGTVVLWEIAVRAFRVQEYILPAPSRALAQLLSEWKYLLFHSWVTTQEILLGFALAVVVGVPAAVLIAYSPLFERSLYPLLVASQSVPKIAIAPLLIFWAGIGMLPKVLVAFLISFFPIVIDTVVGLRSVEPEMLYLAQSMGAPEWRIFTKIRFPSAAPHIFSGLKISITLAVVGAIVGEFIQADQGLGYALLQSSSVINTPLSFAVILILAALGVLLFTVIDWFEKRLIYWHASQRARTPVGTM